MSSPCPLKNTNGRIWTPSAVISMPAVADSSGSSGSTASSSDETNELRPPANRPSWKQQILIHWLPKYSITLSGRYGKLYQANVHLLIALVVYNYGHIVCRIWVRVRVRVTLQLTVSQSVCLGVEPNLGLLTRDIFFFFFLSYSLVLFGAPSLTRGRVCHLSVFVTTVGLQ
jgi:hypothetical protein